jgi:hypothetical protein
MTYAVLAAVALTAGCKATVETEVNLSEILGSNSKMIAGDLYAEVAGCDSYEDSRKPSESLVQAQRNVPSIFEGAEYVECFSKEFDSFARFNIPIALDTDGDDKLSSQEHVNIISDDETLLMVGIPEAIKDNMERVKENSFGMSAFDLEVNIKINNDTGEDFPFRVLSSYVDNKPHVIGDLTSSPDSSFVVTLSDVSVDRALEEGVALVMVR